MRSDNTRGKGNARVRSCVVTLVLAALVPALGVSGPVIAGSDRITTLTVSPQDSTLWVGTARGLFRSGDQGRTLTSVALPAEAATAEVTAVAVDVRSPRTVYVATGGNGILKSEDGGAGWVAASSGLTGLDVRGLTVSPTDGKLHAYARGKGMFRSRAGARSWEWVDAGPRGAMHTLASVNISTGMGGIFLYAATDQGLVRGPD